MNTLDDDSAHTAPASQVNVNDAGSAKRCWTYVAGGKNDWSALVASVQWMNRFIASPNALVTRRTANRADVELGCRVGMVLRHFVLRWLGDTRMIALSSFWRFKLSGCLDLLFAMSSVKEKITYAFAERSSPEFVFQWGTEFLIVGGYTIASLNIA